MTLMLLEEMLGYPVGSLLLSTDSRGHGCACATKERARAPAHPRAWEHTRSYKTHNRIDGCAPTPRSSIEGYDKTRPRQGLRGHKGTV